MGLSGLASNLALALGPALGGVIEGHARLTDLCVVSLRLALLGLGLPLAVPETGHPPPRRPFRLQHLLARQALHPAAATCLLFVHYGVLMGFLPLLARARGVERPGILTPWAIYGARLLFGLGFGLAEPVPMAWAADRVLPSDHGRALATSRTAWELGIGGGQLLFGALLPVGGFAGLFTGAAALALVGSDLAICGRDPRAPQTALRGPPPRET